MSSSSSSEIENQITFLAVIDQTMSFLAAEEGVSILAAILRQP
jgi:hypothetical protein